MDKRVLIITMSFLACGMLPRVFAQTTPPIPTATALDNSGINTRDRASNAMTAGEQSGAKSDLRLTAQSAARLSKTNRFR